MYDVLKKHWVAGAGFIAAGLLAMVPVVAGEWPVALLLIFLHQPAYMIHQVEEHVDDRFRTFMNREMFGGREGLTTGNVILINVGYVWGANLAALYVARFVGGGWALAAPYLLVVNGAAHIAAAIVRRGYNPGLVTSCVIFAPLGAATLYFVPGTMAQECVGLGIAVGVHLVLIVSVLVHRKRLKVAAG